MSKFSVHEWGIWSYVNLHPAWISSVYKKASQSPPGNSIQMGLLYCMIMYCACVYVCAVCIHSCVGASCLIHTSCIIELVSGFSPLWWRQWAWRISCYQEARESCDDMTAAGSDGQALWSTRCSSVLFPRSPVLCLPCPLELVGFLCCCWQLGRSLEGRDGECRDAKAEIEIWGKNRERQDARCKSLWRLLSISVIDLKGMWAQHLT